MLDALPIGWSFDKTVGSPLAGYVFATNGKSVISGQERALIKQTIPRVDAPERAQSTSKFAAQKTEIKQYELDPEARLIINKLGREASILRLLADIRIDMMVCELEGWDKTEYIEEICRLVRGLAPSQRKIQHDLFA